MNLKLGPGWEKFAKQFQNGGDQRLLCEVRPIDYNGRQVGKAAAAIFVPHPTLAGMVHMRFLDEDGFEKSSFSFEIEGQSQVDALEVIEKAHYYGLLGVYPFKPAFRFDEPGNFTFTLA